ncbi:MAG: hypothetical protein OHK0046_15020 [Anaerolineae bacterium]
MRILPLFMVAAALWLVAAIMLLPVRAYTTYPDCIQEIGTWQAAAPAPNYHMEGVAAVVEGRLFQIGGFATYDTTLHPSTAISVYDPIANLWSVQPNPVPYGGSHTQGVTDGRYIYVVGGFLGSDPGVATSDVWRYDTQTDNWAALSPLPEPRASGGTALLGNTLHYIGGLLSDRKTDANTHWSLDLTDPEATWQTVTTFTRARNHFQAVVAEDKIYAVGGQNGHDGKHTDLPYLDVFDPATLTWTPLADLPNTRSHAEMGTFVANDRILVVGGRQDINGTHPTNTVLEYNPQTNTWAQIGTLPKGLMSVTAQIVDEVLVITGGGVNWYTPQNETWIAPLINNCQLPEQPPQADDDAYTYNSDVYPAAQSFPSVLENDFNRYDDPLTAELVTSPENGSIMLNADGTFTYTPDGRFAGVETFTYRARNVYGASNVAVVTLTIPNPPPIAVDDALLGAVGQTIVIPARLGILTNDNDPNNDPLEAILTEDVSMGLLELGRDGALTYTAPADFAGTVSFYYAASDGVNLSTPAQVTLELPMPAITPTIAENEPIYLPTPTAISLLPTMNSAQRMVLEGDLTRAPVRPDFVLNLAYNANGVPQQAAWYNLSIKTLENVVVLDKWYRASEICTYGRCLLHLTADDLPGGLMNGVYTWSVNAWADEAMEPFAFAQNFRVELAAPTALADFSVSATTGRPIIRYTREDSAAQIEVYLEAEDGTMLHQSLTEVCDTTLCSLLPDANPLNGSYRAYVRIIGPGGSTDWSSPKSFSVNLPAPDLPRDLSGAFHGDRPDLRWSHDSSATWYEVWIGQEGSTLYQQWHPAHGLECLNTGVCRLRPALYLNDAGTYAWYVRAWGPGGYSSGGDFEGWAAGTPLIRP